VALPRRPGRHGQRAPRLDAIRKHRRKILGIVNQIDRVPPLEVPELVGAWRWSSADVLRGHRGAVGPRGPAGQARGGRRTLRASGLAPLEALLADRFYANALVLKRARPPSASRSS